MILEVESECIHAERFFQVFGIENSPWHTLQVTNFFPVIIFFKTYIIKGLNLALTEFVFKIVWILSKKGSSRINGALIFS